MSKTDWKALESEYLMTTYKRQPVVLVRGDGVRVWDEEDRVYLDLVAGIAVNVLGHAPRVVADAVHDQAHRLVHTSNLYYTIPQIELARLLVEHSCADRVFFCNSGAEANEGAIKLARKWGKLHRNGAYEVISAEESFHGRTLAAIAATGQHKYQAPFAPMPDGFTHVPYNDLKALKTATTEKTVAILLEPVQGESGVHPARRDYLQAVRAWCDEQQLLLIFDEVQTGMGRTGKLFGYQHFGIEPDVITLAKGLAGGLPIGAILAKQSACVFEPGDHASTFGGNPLVCTAALATLRQVLNEKLPERAARLGALFYDGLEQLRARFPIITEVRGIGLMLGFDLNPEVARKLVAVALEHGVIINATSDKTIRLVPPLILTEDEVREALTLLARSLHDLSVES